MTALIPKALLFLSVLAWISACAAQTVERIGPAPSDIPDAVRPAIEQKGYRVSLNKSVAAVLWFTKKLSTTKKDAPGALYPELDSGEFVGVVEFRDAFTDFRGQSIPPGVYTLRYQLLPQDGNHLGVAPTPDFLLAIPVASDAHPEETYPYKKLVALSAKSSGGSHPAVIMMETAGEPGTVTKTEAGSVFSFAIPTASGTQKIGICLTCSASQ